MIFFLHGEDDFLVNKRRSVLLKSFMKKYPEGEFFLFDFEDQGTIDAVRKGIAVCASGLFSSRKMVVFLHPLELEETAEKLFLEFLEDFIKRGETEVTLLFAQPGKIKKTHPLVKFLAKHSDKEEIFSKPDVKNLGEYIKKELSLIDAQAAFSREALATFVAFVGNNTVRIQTELEKLSVFKPGGIFEKEDILSLVGSTAENVVFDALDALGRGDKKKALIIFRREELGAEGVHSILALCAWQVRRLLQVRELYDRGIFRPADIALQTKIHPFVVQKTLGVINNFSMTRIKKGLILLSDFDTALKQGNIEPSVALDLFVWKF